MKKLLRSGLCGVAAMLVASTAFCGGGGDAFAGSLGGSLVGSMVGTSIATRPSGGGGGGSDDSRAIRAVDRLEDMVKRDLNGLDKRLKDVESDVEDLNKKDGAEGVDALQKTINGLKTEVKTLKTTVKDLEEKVSDSNDMQQALEKRLAKLEAAAPGKSVELGKPVETEQAKTAK
jgi:hypothetical protein